MDTRQIRKLGQTLRLLCAALLLAGCAGGPHGPLAGGRLDGKPGEARVVNWDFAKSSEHVDLEVRGDDPYSVTIHYYVVDGALYIEAGDNYWSRWRPMLRADPQARVRFGGTVYPVQAVEVTDAAEIARVLPHFYEKDRDEPSDACRATWDPQTCAFAGRFYRLDLAHAPRG